MTFYEKVCFIGMTFNFLEWSAQVLRHEFHRNIQVCKYKPSSANDSILAVGTERGICLWDTTQRLTPFFESVDENRKFAREEDDIFLRPKRQYKDETQNGACVFLRTSTPVTTIDWFPPTHAVTKKVIAHQQIVDDVIYTDMFVSGGINDHRVMIWQLIPPANESRSTESWNYDWQCVQILNRKNGGIKSLAFSPNGRYLAVFTM
jgi:WD40 repeat protein